MRGNPHKWRVTVDGCIVSTSHKTKSEMFAVSFSASCKWIREWKGVETIS